MRILFVAAEMSPLVKVGGLADVAGALPAALRALGHDVRVLLPCYGRAMARGATPVAELGRGQRLLAPARDDLAGGVWLLQTPALSRRAGNPYVDAHGAAWADEAQVFNRLSQVAAGIAAGRLVEGWQADVVHCNDWHSALTPVWMLLGRVPAASVFTIHNLSCQGLFAPELLGSLGLPGWLHHPDALEFHGRIAFIKGGLAFSQQLTTVSPGYAREILEPGGGNGLDGLLRHRREVLHGIVNGIDEHAWSPRRDPHLRHRYDPRDPGGKALERADLLRTLGIGGDGSAPVLLGWVNRLTWQKGADLLVEALPELLSRPNVRVVVLGSGEAAIEAELRRLAQAWPGRLALRIGFDEALSHRVYAASDIFLMPSHFEPCGLSQMYAMRYGAVPVVRAVGGLRDTVQDAADVGEAGATGFVFGPATGGALLSAVDRALALRARPEDWATLMQRCMKQRFSWRRSARAYERVYDQAIRTLGR